MTHKLISSAARYEREYGHSRAVVAGDFIFVAGTVGYDYEKDMVSDDPAEQTRQTFRNIRAALEKAGASFSDVVQIITYYTSQADWPAIGAVLKEELAGVHPGNTGVKVELIDPKMKVEISAVAVRS